MSWLHLLAKQTACSLQICDTSKRQKEECRQWSSLCGLVRLGRYNKNHKLGNLETADIYHLALEAGCLRPKCQHSLLRVLFRVTDFSFYLYIAEGVRDPSKASGKAQIPFVRVLPS